MLMIERSELVIERRMRGLQFGASAEKRLGNNGEEFDTIFRAVRIDNRGLAGVYCVPEALIFIAEYLSPGRMLARFQERRAVGDGVLEVELVRKFVQHNINPRVATFATARYVVPRNNDCAKPKTCFAQAVAVAFFPNAVAHMALAAGDIRTGVDENGSQARVIVRVTAKEKNRGIRCDCDPNLIGEFQPAAALEPLLGEQHLCVAEESSPICGRQRLEEDNIVLDDSFPLGRKRERA